jgi:hypothetical protein
VTKTQTNEFLVKGPDGTDLLVDIEVLRFANIDYAWNDQRGDLVPFVDTARGFRLFAGDHFRGTVGGIGQVFGTTNSGQTIRVQEGSSIAFDPSFNRGPDEIFLDGDADEWLIARFGSSVSLTNEDSVIVVPVGKGLGLGFDDGVRNLFVDSKDGAIKVGNGSSSQTVADSPAVIAVPRIDLYLGNDGITTSSGRLFLQAGTFTEFHGGLGSNKLAVFGSAGAESLTIGTGIYELDPSFNRGGDLLTIDTPGDHVTAVRSGSSVVLTAPGTTVTIPVGTEGMEVRLRGAGGTLVYDVASNEISLGDLVIGTTPVSIPVFG